MTWDAFASIDINEDGTLRKYHQLFYNAQQVVLNGYGTADDGLKKGCLESSLCGAMLEQATGLSCHVDYWEVVTVKVAYNKADWFFHINRYHEWAWASAPIFLEVCASCEIGIEFNN